MSNTIWNRLMEFESRDLVENYIMVKHGREAPARQLLEITSNFIQGREYFKNAAASDIVVKLLLLYYGVASLSRGLMLAKQPKTSTASLKPAHGLETVDWQQALSKYDFGDLRVRMTEGAFLDLLNATENKSYLKNKSSGVNWHIGYIPPEPGTTLCPDNLLKTFADLSDQYEKWQSAKSIT